MVKSLFYFINAHLLKKTWWTHLCYDKTLFNRGHFKNNANNVAKKIC